MNNQKLPELVLGIIKKDNQVLIIQRALRVLQVFEE